MIILHRLDEDKIEEAFWAFDARRKVSGDERGAFKEQMRSFARYQLERAGVQHDIEMLEDDAS